MTDNVTRRAILGGLLAGVGQTAWAGAPEASLRPIVRSFAPGIVALPGADKLIKAAGLRGKIGYVVADAASGEILERYNPVLALPPASVAKAVTAQYALETLGADHRFVTRLMATGPVTNGILAGDLVLLGGGDPTLDTNALAELATRLKAAGLREVRGKFLVSSGALPHVHQIDRGQPGHLGYNPAVSGLNLNYNRVYFEWKKANGDYTVTMDARSAKYRPEVALTQMKVVDRRSPIYTYTNGGSSEQWTVARNALGSKGARWLPVRQPELYAGEVFQTFMRSHGIQLAAPVHSLGPVVGTVLLERASPELSAIVKGMLARSNNMTAEVLGLSASVARVHAVSGLGQSAAEMSRWMTAGHGARRPRFVDHSGLGDKSRISAADMVAGLVSVGADSALAGLLKTLQLRDAKGNGTSGVKTELKVKTGTLNFVSALAGYIKTEANRDLAFAIFSADIPRRSAIPIAQRERPPGARSWSSRSRRLQHSLINRWAKLYL